MPAMTEKTEERIRLSEIDLLKCFAIFFVLMYHNTLYPYYAIDEAGNAIFHFGYFSRTILSTCVPLFFFANGYLILGRPFHLKKHIKKTVKLALLAVIWGGYYPCYPDGDQTAVFHG